jgi:putative spermidine/putrescine transport system ATP-binding protein/spermidine/putrescine transport system ATP-binding protein
MSSVEPSIAAATDVRFDHVVKHYGRAVAVHDLSLDIPRGMFFSLLGPSGCGKTTTLRLIAGFEQPSEGDVYIRENRVTQVPPYRRDFAMVFQNFALFPHLTVAENVGFGLRMTGVGRADRDLQVRQALDLVKLGTFADRFPKQMSGGQQQRVAIARAVVMKPAVLLLDEPLGALDKNLREEMQVELRALQRQLGLTTVFVTHDQEEALTMSDLIAVMRDGVIEQIGPPREIYEQPATDFVATFLGASNLFDATVLGPDGDGTMVETPAGRFKIAEPALPAGAALRLAIRPERLRVRSASAGAGLTATVREIIYRGTSMQLFLDSAGTPLVATVQNAAASGLDWSRGELVTLDFDPGSVVVLAGGR